MLLPSRLEQLEINLDTAYRKYEFKRGKLLRAVDDDQEFKLHEDLAALSRQIAAMESDWATQISPIAQKMELSSQEAEPLVGEWIHATEKAMQRCQGDAPVLEKLTRLLTELQTGKAASAKLKITLPIVPLLVNYEMELDTESTLSQLWRKTRAFFTQEAAKNP